jgi:hypothetical protein
MENKLFIQNSDETGNLIIKPVPGQVICEFDPIPEAEDYAKTFVELYNKFPNGFTSWQETNYEFIAIIERFRAMDKPPVKIQEINDQQGTGGFWKLAENLTNKFEQEHINFKFDGEFFDHVENYFNEWLNEK